MTIYYESGDIDDFDGEVAKAILVALDDISEVPGETDSADDPTTGFQRTGAAFDLS